MSGKSQTIGDFTVSRPSQILRSNGDGDGSDNGKKLRNRLRLARESRFFVDFFAVTAQLRRGEREHQTTTFFFLFFPEL